MLRIKWKIEGESEFAQGGNSRRLRLAIAIILAILLILAAIKWGAGVAIYL